VARLISDPARVKIGAMRWLILVVVLLIAATGVTFARYGSLSPCRWLVVDTAKHTGLPQTLASARARADMAAHGDRRDALAARLRAFEARNGSLPPS
jgi:hypothetical protein